MISAVDRVVVHTVVENFVDMLLPDTDRPVRARRLGLVDHFDPKRRPPLAENGISYLVEIFNDYRVYRVLFDAGLTPGVLLHNLRVLGLAPWEIDHVVLSHGHPDHYGGIFGVLRAAEHPVPLALHPGAFPPRYLAMGSGDVAPYYNHPLTPDALESAGAKLVQARGPITIGPGVLTSGEIQRQIPFEGPRPPKPGGASLTQLNDAGHLDLDEVWDDLAVIINLRDLGLVVLTGCAHAGVINSIKHAQAITGVERVHAVLGGFHLGFPGVPRENIEGTIDELKQLDVDVVSPMHCSGFEARAAVARALPDQFFLNSVGSTLYLGTGSVDEQEARRHVSRAVANARVEPHRHAESGSVANGRAVAL